MGICSRRHFLLTICILQLITTIERQVFDSLGFMWAPILVNFFNIIFVILGFFGAFQYRPKYIIVYCVWNVLWLGWNIFLICFYLSVGILDKDSDVLNLGTGSFSWWQANGPGCKATYNVTEQEESSRPPKPANVTDCILDYQVIEVFHAGTQCLLALMAIVGGICLSRVFLEEDDSFDFVGGGDFGLAGHTPLHPMYVSYSALPPPPYNNSNTKSLNTNKSGWSGTAGSSQRSLNRSDNHRHAKNSDMMVFNTSTARSRNASSRNNTARSNKSNLSVVRNVVDRDNSARHNVEYPIDYSNPLDYLQRSVSPCDEYDSLDGAAKGRYQKSKHYYPHSSKYSPVVSAKIRPARTAANKQHRNSYKPRIFTDHVREQPLRSFYSDPRLAVNVNDMTDTQNRAKGSKRESRPLSLYGNNF
ncbi:sodium/potassium-transporting ATPase subunit beta-1-interacting protein isoform X2 [Neodiprion fabricii]|uniref:sodium/potassium-transporting ATPase subunit beta-1-interacting protein isoform X2 n=1 Tax=Neodiprion fabricii TaxID=2872261 RepID=UPI001ED90BFA|nr:sodium/potassium-transporting ATPase subunit beta-1-interacting protein isoform X2 [Neodiprion fabricii]